MALENAQNLPLKKKLEHHKNQHSIPKTSSRQTPGKGPSSYAESNMRTSQANKQARRDARDMKRAAKRALTYAEIWLVSMEDRHGEQGTPETRGAIHEAAEIVEAYRTKGRECAYSNRKHKRFLRTLRQFTDRIHEVKDWYMCRTGRCIDCSENSHQQHECTSSTEDNSSTEWDTSDEENNGNDLLPITNNYGTNEETLEDGFWRTKQVMNH